MTSAKDPASDAIALYERMGERTTQPFALKLLDQLAPLSGRSVIDIAAGTGGLALAAAERGAWVLATDINPAMVKRAAERLRSFQSCAAEAMDFQALAVEDGSQDIAISHFGVLAYPTWQSGLQEMVRVTRPGGRIAMTMWTQTDDSSPAHLMLRVFQQLFPGRELWPVGLFPIFTEQSLRDSLQDVGCTDVDVHVAQADWSPFSSAEVVSECDPMFKSFPGYQALTASEAELLRNSLQAAFDGYADTNGKIHLPTKAFMATARID